MARKTRKKTETASGRRRHCDQIRPQKANRSCSTEGFVLILPSSRVYRRDGCRRSDDAASCLLAWPRTAPSTASAGSCALELNEHGEGGAENASHPRSARVYRRLTACRIPRTLCGQQPAAIATSALGPQAGIAAWAWLYVADRAPTSPSLSDCPSDSVLAGLDTMHGQQQRPESPHPRLWRPPSTRNTHFYDYILRAHKENNGSSPTLRETA